MSSFYLEKDKLEELTRYRVHLIEDNKPPLLAPHPLHDSLCLPGALGGVAQHGVGADGHRAADGLVLGVGGEAADLRIINSGPHLELSLPLLHRHRRVAKDEAAFPHGARCSNTHQRFACSWNGKGDVR